MNIRKKMRSGLIAIFYGDLNVVFRNRALARDLSKAQRSDIAERRSRERAPPGIVCLEVLSIGNSIPELGSEL